MRGVDGCGHVIVIVLVVVVVMVVVVVGVVRRQGRVARVVVRHYT